jgi:hypothetical protein
MTDAEEQIDSLRWAIDRQKSDLASIRKQLRRYLVLIVTIVAIRLAAFLGGGGTVLDGTGGGPLRKNGILWQTNILQPKAAPIFIDTYTTFAAIFSGLGLGILGTAIYGIIMVERLDGCSPLGNALDVADGNVDQLKDWIESNDEIIARAEYARKSIIRLGTNAILLLVSAFLLQYIANSSAIVGFFFLLTTYLAYWRLLVEDELAQRSQIKKLIDIVIIVATLSVPLGPYQEVYGSLPDSLLWGWFLIVVAIVGFYVRSEIWEFVKSLPLDRATDTDEE